MSDDPLMRSLPPQNKWKSDSLRNLTDSLRRVRDEAIMKEMNDVQGLPPLKSNHVTIMAAVAARIVAKPLPKSSHHAMQKPIPRVYQQIGAGWIQSLPKIPGQSQRLRAVHQKINNGKRFFAPLSPLVKTTKEVTVASSAMVTKKACTSTVASTHHSRYEAGNAMMHSRKLAWLSASEKTKAATAAKLATDIKLDALRGVYGRQVAIPFKSSEGSRLTRLRIAPSGPGYAGSTHFPTLRKLFRNHTGCYMIAYQEVDRSPSKYT